MKDNNTKYTGLEIAVIGMACRFPGALNWKEYWSNLKNGIESVHFFSEEELKELEGETDTKDKKFVPAGAVLDNKDFFDAAFFDYRPDTARVMNPETRIFHECIWEAFEDAGYVPELLNDPVALFAGGADDFNWKAFSVLANKEQLVDDFTLRQLNNKDFLPTLISYKLNLKGPSISVNTTCSTSLVAIHLACRSLLLGEARMAAAGGVSLLTDKFRGYMHREGMIFSSDGHCRAFDRKADGTIDGEGCGVVILKRLKDAISDNDNIHAIIKGSAINNDGSRKVGYTAPSVEGQAECIKLAHRFSKINPASVSFIETHGTGTNLGDPIEVEALNMAFGNVPGKKIPIGAVKANIGHLNMAAGVAGFIKTVLSLKYSELPPSINYEAPNPKIDFSSGPFYVNNKLLPLKRNEGEALCAGVSAFGIGGTNAHIVLQESETQQHGKNDTASLLIVSGLSEAAMNRNVSAVDEYLKNTNFAEHQQAAYTLQVGRKPLPFRAFAVYDPAADEFVWRKQATLKKELQTGFLFSGQGSHYPGMCSELYANHPLFKKHADRCFELLSLYADRDIKALLFSADKNKDQQSLLDNIRYSTPAIFVVEYAYASYLADLGVEAQLLAGHSLGEFTAACVAGVFSLEDAIKIVWNRGRLMSELPQGSMTAVADSADTLKGLLSGNLAVAAVNSPFSTIVSGPSDEMEVLEGLMTEQIIKFRRLPISHASHSKMMHPLSNDFMEVMSSVKLNPPSKKIISTATGKLLKAVEATDPAYWVNHLLTTVLFSDAIESLIKYKPDCMIEIGPGKSLCSFTKQQLKGNPVKVLQTLRTETEKESDDHHLSNLLGELWLSGAAIHWNKYNEGKGLKKVSLPTYAFEKSRFTSEINLKAIFNTISGNKSLEKKTKYTDWIYRVVWKQSLAPPAAKAEKQRECMLIFSENNALENQLQKQYNNSYDFVIVKRGVGFEQISDSHFMINQSDENDYRLLFDHLKRAGISPARIIHTWNYDETRAPANTPESLEQDRAAGYDSILMIARNFSELFSVAALKLDVIANGLYSLTGDEQIHPGKAPLTGAVKVIPFEFLNISTRILDITDTSERTVKVLCRELDSGSKDPEIAIRGNSGYVKSYANAACENIEDNHVFRAGGVYLISGAAGGMAKIIAGYLAADYKATLILLSRSPLQQSQLDELRLKGATVFTVVADLSDKKKINTGIAEAEKKSGKINGVFHTAGIADLNGVIIRRSAQSDQQVFIPKTEGTQNLIAALADHQPDFFVNTSSNSATVMPFGEVAYAAANLYQDAVAISGQVNYPFISIQWDLVQDTGMAIRALNRFPPAERKKQFELGIPVDDYMKIMKKVIALKIPVPIISTIDFETLLEHHYAQFDKDNEQPADSTGLQQEQERPELEVAFEAPSNETEEKLAEMVRAFFGLKTIGVNDNFFELGGDSLMALTFCARIYKAFGAEISLAEFFRSPTVRQLSALLAAPAVKEEQDMNVVII